MKNNRYFYFVSVLLTALILVSCGGSGSGGSDDGDADVDLDNGGGKSCFNDIDCAPPMVCRDRFCVNPESAEDAGECKTQFDCPADKYCDTELGVCKPLDVDGDEEEESEADIEDAEPDVEVEPELEYDTEAEEENGPLIDVQFTTPGDGRAVRGQVVLQVQVVSELAIDRVEFFQGSDMIGAAVSSEPYMQIWETDGLEEGSYHISAKAYSGEESAESGLNVFVDRSGPHAEIVTPAADEIFYYGDEIIFSLLAYDHLESVTVLIDDEEETVITEFDGTDSVSHTIFAGTLDAGAHILKAVVQDQAGNAPVTVEVPINIETDAPELIIEGLTFTDDENAWIMANDSFTVDAEDVSGLSYVNIQFIHSSTIILSTTDTDDLPFYVGNFDATLLEGMEVYPVSATLSIRADDRFGNSVLRNINVTIKRESWTFEHGLTLPQGVTWDDTYAAAVNSAYGDVYYVYYNTLISLTTDGYERWRKTFSQPISSSPVLFEGQGRPVVVVLADAQGSLYFCEDNEIQADCTSYSVSGYTILKPATPALEKLPADWDGAGFDLYYCGRVATNSRCWRLTYSFADDRAASVDEVWILPAILPDDEMPTSPIIPAGDSASSNYFYVGCGQNIYKYSKAGGEYMNSTDISFAPEQSVVQIMPNPAGHGIYGVSDKEFRLYTESMAQKGLYQLYAVTQNIFEPVQAVAHVGGVFFTSSTTYDSGISKGYLQGWELDGYSIGASVMSFLDSSRIGGTPALGNGGMIYIPGRSNLGKFWAVRWLPEHPRLCSEIEEPSGACGVIPDVGCCSNGDLLQYCDGGVLKAEDCSDNEFGFQSCGWEESAQKYGCRSTQTTQKGGKLFWRTQFGEPILAPLTIDMAGNIIIVHKDGTIRSVQASAGRMLESGGWPQYQGDSANSGRYLP